MTTRWPNCWHRAAVVEAVGVAVAVGAAFDRVSWRAPHGK